MQVGDAGYVGVAMSVFDATRRCLFPVTPPHRKALPKKVSLIALRSGDKECLADQKDV
jgi:hypothetical protein